MRIIAVGKVSNKAYANACDTYLKRLKPLGKLDVVEVKESRGKASSAQQKADEATRILAAIRPRETLVLLDEHGKTYSTEAFATWLGTLQVQSIQPVFVICGANGPTDALRSAAKHRLSLSPMTFPHELARVMLVEQLYRVHTIWRNMPYHK